MNQNLKEALWNQFGASIDSLEKAIEMCPPALWDNEQKFWYLAFHALFFTDYYLTLNPTEFAPPPPFSLSEFGDGMPERTYTKDELLDYLKFCREKCRSLIFNLTEEIAETNWENESKTMIYPVVEIIIYNLRHVQHHAAQLNQILRREINDAPNWVFRAN